MNAPSAPPVAVVGVGAQAPVGRTAAAVAAAVRARVPNVAAHPFLVDRFGEPVVVARAPWLPADLGPEDRLAALGGEAAREALGVVRAGNRARCRLAVVVGLPAIRPGTPAGLAERLLPRLVPEPPPGVTALPPQPLMRGRAAGLTALLKGFDMIRGGGAEFCLAGGVDSFVDRQTLEWLDWSGQLHAANNPFGFIPGEGAGFCLLASEQAAASARLPVLGWLLGGATVLEPKLPRDGAVCTGEGLTRAIQEALAALPPVTKVDHTIGDLNGQPRRADEMGFALVRLVEHFHDPGRFDAPADCWGDVGAASGPLFLSLAVARGRKGYGRGPYTLLWSAAAGADRAAALLHVPLASEG